MQLTESFSHLPYLVFLFFFLLIGFFVSKPKTEIAENVISNRTTFFLVIIITILAGLVRLYGLDFGFPRFYHPDERKKIYIISKMLGRNSLDPNYFFHPSLLLYLTICVTKILAFLGIENTNFFFGTSSNVELSGSLRILYAGRLVSVIFGTLSIPILFACAKNIYGTSAGLLSAVLLAFSSLHVTCSRYLKEDCLLTFFTLVIIYFSINFLKTKNSKYLVIVSFFIGIACASKYTAVLLIYCLFIMPWLGKDYKSFRDFIRPDLKILKLVFKSSFLVPVGFFIFSPYSFINLAQSIGGIIAEASHAAEGHHGLVISALSEWFLFHFSRSIVPGIGYGATACALMFITSSVRNINKYYVLLLLLLLIFYFSAELIPSKPMPQPDRYILPCIPFICIFASAFIVKFRSKLIVFFLTIIVVFSSLHKTLALAKDISPDTRKIATTWILENIKESSKILTFGGAEYLCYIPQKFHSVAARKVIGTEKTNITERLKNSGYDYLIHAHFAQHRLEIIPHPAPLRKAAMDEIKRTFTIAASIKAPSGSYGFHNPTIDVYKLK